jgi:histidinol-phosphate aminotransferase
MTAPTPQPGILDIAPYIGGKAGAAGMEQVIKLSSNESALGPSPKAMAAYEALAKTLHRYPDGGSTSLRDALAAHHGLVADRIVCGNGSDELISLLTAAYSGPGDEVLYSQHGFLMYPLAALACGATPVAAPESNYTASVDALLAAVTERTKIVFLANPNNPTGTYLPSGEVKRLRDGLPEHVLLVIDAAYAEFVNRNDYTSGVELVENADNTVMTRTFSKIYGLAGLRIGWAYCPWRVADVLHRVRGPFNVNGAAQAAALAALQDVAFTDAARTHNDVWLPKLIEGLNEAGLETVPSVGNFVLIRFPETPGRTAAEANAFLAGRGVLLRDMVAYKLPDCLRATVGTADEVEAVIEGCKAFMAGGGGS